MEITYLGHSGFEVKTGGRTLVFDCVDENYIPQPGAAVFVSHAHGDHFCPVVAQRAERLITALDVDMGGHRLSPGDRLTLPGLVVRAFGSTDEGVSFLVTVNGKNIFHAGDFNFWHWRAESTEEEVRWAEDYFLKVLEPMKGIPVDAAFFPVDPRMGEGYAEGAERYLQAIRPKLLVPMHFWDRPEAAKEFAEKFENVHAMTVPGERFEVKGE